MIVFWKSIIQKQRIREITGNNDTDLYSYFEEHEELPDIITVRRFSGADTSMFQIRSRKNIICYFQKCIFPRYFWKAFDRDRHMRPQGICLSIDIRYFLEIKASFPAVSGEYLIEAGSMNPQYICLPFYIFEGFRKLMIRKI